MESARGAGRHQLAVPDEQQTQRHYRPFEHPSERQEVPAFVARHRLARHAGEGLALRANHGVELVGLAPDVVAQVASGQPEVERVDRFPHLRADQLANRSQVLPCLGHVGADRSRIRRVEHQELRHDVGLQDAFALREGEVDVEDLEQVVPRRGLAAGHCLEMGVVGHVEQSRGRFGPFDVATGPEQ